MLTEYSCKVREFEIKAKVLKYTTSHGICTNDNIMKMATCIGLCKCPENECKATKSEKKSHSFTCDDGKFI